MGSGSQTGSPSSVAVVGGGPAGMTAALLLARAGHRVRLVEAGAELGGLWASRRRADGTFLGDGYSEDAGDCDDNDDSTYPGATELPDWRDNDCDTVVDEETVNVDDDGDGFSEIGGDCDDANPFAAPDLPEVPGNAVDENCDGSAP